MSITHQWFTTMTEVRDTFNDDGNHFFDESTLRFFSSEIDDEIYGGRVFVTSEQQEETYPRLYTVRVIEYQDEDKHYTVASLGFGALDTHEEAHDAAYRAGELADSGLLPGYFQYGQEAALARALDIPDTSDCDGWVFDHTTTLGFRQV
jgi:hypothetical protein